MDTLKPLKPLMLGWLALTRLPVWRMQASRERPSLEGLPVKMKWKVNDYLVHQVPPLT